MDNKLTAKLEKVFKKTQNPIARAEALYNAIARANGSTTFDNMGYTELKMDRNGKYILD